MIACVCVCVCVCVRNGEIVCLFVCLFVLGGTKSGKKSFHCRHGKAYLFNMVVNVHEGPKEDRLMTTGLHTVADIHCKSCMQIVGWKYVRPCRQIHTHIYAPHTRASIAESTTHITSLSQRQ